MAGPHKVFIRSLQVTNHGSVRMSPQQSHSPPCEPNPTKVICAKIISKQMVARFFSKTGHVATVSLQHRRTVNSERYTMLSLAKIFEEIRKTNKRRPIIVHHDSAFSHISAPISALFTGQNVESMGHTPYSSDLAPNDFFLFVHIKRKMRGQRFSKTMFWRCLNRSGKTNTNDGRTSKARLYAV